jgi:signal transduction histidine kinase
VTPAPAAACSVRPGIISRRTIAFQGGVMDKADPKLLSGHLTSSVGHHVINAFSTIVSQGEILRSLMGADGDASGEVNERIETIIRTSLEASLMTRRLIEYSHDLTSLEADLPGNLVDDIRLDQLAAEFVNAERDELGPNVSWVLQLDATAPFRGQPTTLQTMLKLLIANAVEALPDQTGTIAITTFLGPRNWPVLEISDQGCGMTPEVMEHALEPFFSTKPGHPGIGLTIARGIWRRHRGTLTIESKPGEGTTVRLSAPPRSSAPSRS